MTIDRGELQDAARRAFGDTGLQQGARATWTRIVEMGWLGMTVSEELGGLGLGNEATAIVHQELGRTLAPGPLIAQLATIELLSNAGAKPFIDQAFSGSLITTALHFSAVREVDGTLSGTLRAVPDADWATQLLLVTDRQVRIIPLGMSGVEMVRKPTWDKSRRLFDIILDGVSARSGLTLADGIDARELSAALEAHILFALAADSLGGAEAMLAMTVDYLGTRRQFDRPLAMFQALKHRCADLKTSIAGADALLWSHGRRQFDNAGNCRTAAGSLKAHVAAVYQSVAEESIQLHGGIGLTQEHPCHLFMKRAMLNASLGDSSDNVQIRAGRQLVML
ncbi:MAG TPA: acyl-CoA dehydrogenase family protein [Sphingobium sp.]|uniref:acyl-CoA dehydrogenase family protein n=1 Tax=Sphingobium sp. TaxID=1912891 RepID=UPI002ED53CE1